MRRGHVRWGMRYGVGTWCVGVRYGMYVRRGSCLLFAFH